MTPLVLVIASLIAVAAGVITLVSFGPRYRVGRLLATTRRVSVAEAIAIAGEARPRYVRVDGRIDATDEFEDADHRPLVFRRTRLQARTTRGWTALEDSRESVAFDVREGLDAIGVDADALDTGLVVVPRESLGVARDLAVIGREPSTLDPETPVRAIIEQVSSVEHAIVLGVPVKGEAEAGGARLTAGLGRPLVLSTLEPDEAMRILAGGTGRPRIVVACFAVAALLLTAAIAWAGLGAAMSAIVPVARAASPSPAPGGDPRSSGEGPGLVGEPALALLAVAGIALLAIVVTLAYLRVSDSDPTRPISRR